MKNGLKSILCLMLAVLMIVPALVSCANDTNETPNTTQGTGVNVDNEPEPEFRDADYSNYGSFKFLWYGTRATDFADEYIWSDGVTGSAIGDAVMDRNRAVEEKYKVTIEAEECSPMGEATTRMKSGQCDFHVIYEWGSRSVNTILDGMIYDVLDLEDYCNFENSYWVPNVFKNMTVADHVFLFTNYISMNSFAWADITFFNTDMIKELQLTIPYDYVEANEWTFDVYLDMCAAAAADLDGDGAISSIDDRYADLNSAGGVLSWIISKSIGGSASMLQMNDDGTVTLVMASEKCLTAYENYNKRLQTAKGFASYGDVFGMGLDLTLLHDSPHVATRMIFFGQNHSLFMGGVMDMSKEFIKQPVNYGVVPAPVYEAGDPYTAGVDGNAPMFTIPFQIEDPEYVGTILEYMAYESEKLLFPAYYDTTIKTKRMEDPRDYDMLDIVKGAADQSWTSFYLGQTDFGGLFGEMMAAGHFASVFRKKSAKIQAQIDETMEKLHNLGS